MKKRLLLVFLVIGALLSGCMPPIVVQSTGSVPPPAVSAEATPAPTLSPQATAAPQPAASPEVTATVASTGTTSMVTTPAGATISQTVTVDGQQIRLDGPLPVDANVRTGVLDNGLTYILRHNAEPQNRAELRLVVTPALVLEDDDQQGLAHLLEHMMFDGTLSFPQAGRSTSWRALACSSGPTSTLRPATIRRSTSCAFRSTTRPWSTRRWISWWTGRGTPPSIRPPSTPNAAWWSKNIACVTSTPAGVSVIRSCLCCWVIPVTHSARRLARWISCRMPRLRRCAAFTRPGTGPISWR